MGIFDRFAQIMKANINELLDKAEDPEKMVAQYMRELYEDLAEVKIETANVMADETQAKRKLDENAAEIEKYAELAKKALKAGNEGDARTLVAKKQELEAKGKSLEKVYEAAKEAADKMRELHDKLVSDIEILKTRQEQIAAKAAVARTQEKVNQFSDGAAKAEGVMKEIDRMEQKVDDQLDRANAMYELNSTPLDEAAAAAARYTGVNDEAVDEELAALKAELGL